MKHYQFFLLMTGIYIAPNLRKDVRLGVGICFLVLAVLSLVYP